MDGYCNKCNRRIIDMNVLEKEELLENKAFVCSDCIQEEMYEDELNDETMKELTGLTDQEYNEACEKGEG